MTLEEFYTGIGNYKTAHERFQNDDFLKKYITKFLQDPSFINLKVSLEEEDYEKAFRAVHTLKGLAATLSFDILYPTAVNITETLRDLKPHDVSKEMQILEKEYKDLISKIEVL